MGYVSEDYINDTNRLYFRGHENPQGWLDESDICDPGSHPEGSR